MEHARKEIFVPADALKNGVFANEFNDRGSHTEKLANSADSWNHTTKNLDGY